MSLSTTPASARTDLAAASSTPSGTRPAATTRFARATGVAVATGSAAWAAGLLVFGPNPDPGWGDTVYNLTSLLFQLGLVALVTLQLRTGATGTGRLARFFLHVEHVLLALAIVSTLTWIFLRQYDGATWFLLLDAFWPLSMLGMAAIGVRIAIAGRWRGAARFWPLVAESWAPVVVPLNAIVPAAAGLAGAAHLMVGYVALGLILARRPELTGARD
ncbi:hypothetical protein ACI789_11580 [Geodermatophilus sp. SYSU D00965]